MRQLAVAVVMLMCAALAHAEPPPANDPSADALAQGWFDQLLGFDALEAYRLGSGRMAMEFAVARKWHDGVARLLIDVSEPSEVASLGFLLLQRLNHSDDFFVYANATRRVRRLRAPDLAFELPPTGASLPIAELRPFTPGELTFERLPDERVEGEPCRVVQGLRGRDWLHFDRIEFALSTRTGVALRTRYLRAGREIRRVEVSPEDVERREDRWLPIRRRVSTPGQGEVELVLRNLMLDPALPDRLFTSHSLRYQRFPAF